MKEKELKRKINKKRKRKGIVNGGKKLMLKDNPNLSNSNK